MSSQWGIDASPSVKSTGDDQEVVSLLTPDSQDDPLEEFTPSRNPFLLLRDDPIESTPGTRRISKRSFGRAFGEMGDLSSILEGPPPTPSKRQRRRPPPTPLGRRGRSEAFPDSSPLTLLEGPPPPKRSRPVEILEESQESTFTTQSIESESSSQVWNVIHSQSSSLLEKRSRSELYGPLRIELPPGAKRFTSESPLIEISPPSTPELPEIQESPPTPPQDWESDQSLSSSPLEEFTLQEDILEGPPEEIVPWDPNHPIPYFRAYGWTRPQRASRMEQWGRRIYFQHIQYDQEPFQWGIPAHEFLVESQRIPSEFYHCRIAPYFDEKHHKSYRPDHRGGDQEFYKMRCDCPDFEKQNPQWAQGVFIYRRPIRRCKHLIACIENTKISHRFFQKHWFEYIPYGQEFIPGSPLE